MLNKLFIILQILGASYLVFCAVIKSDKSNEIEMKKLNNSLKYNSTDNDLIIGDCKETDKVGWKWSMTQILDVWKLCNNPQFFRR